MTQKQCTESKNRSSAQCAHTADPGCVHGAPRVRAERSGRARTLRALVRVAALLPAVSQPCCRPCYSLAWPCRRPMRPYHGLAACLAWPCHGPVSRHNALPHAPSWSRYTTVYCNTNFPAASPSPVTIQWLYRDTLTSHQASACHDTLIVS